MLAAIWALDARPAAAALSSTGPVFTSPFVGQAVFESGPDTLTVVADDGRTRQVSLPVGCHPTAMGPGAVALNCYPARLGLLSLRTGGVRWLPDAVADKDYYQGVREVGSRWLRLEAVDFASPYDVWYARSTVLMQRAEFSKTVDLARDPFGASNVIDLNRRRPVERLCRQARRLPEINHRSDDTFRYSIKIGSRFWQEEHDPPVAVDCRTQTKRTFSYQVSSKNAEFVALNQSATHGRAVLKALDGTFRRRYPLPFEGDQGTGVSLSRGALWLAAGTGAVRRIPLP